MSNWLYVKSCDMPLSCKTCSLEDFAEDGGSYCKINDGWTPPNGKRADCPLIPLPQKHGRLIDADFLLGRLKEFAKGYDPNTFHVTMLDVYRWLEYSTAIIEAEE